MAAAASPSASDPHIPVLLGPILAAVQPLRGTWIDGTMGAGGYTRALLAAGADKVIAIDRDPLAHRMAQDWAPAYGDRLQLVEANFADLDTVAEAVDGVVLDLGVSSMQLDQAERGFSFLRDGPLDMRMSQTGDGADVIVNTATEAVLADILFLYGEERASRRIARAIVKARGDAPIETTARLAGIIESVLPRPKPGQSHPATRSFQALRIAVNDEYGALRDGLIAAEKVLKPGGFLCVVTFHSIEDRMVKRFFQARAGGSRANRYAPATEDIPPAFTMVTRKAVTADADELAANPRARSAKLRIGQRTDAPAGKVTARDIAMPEMTRG